ncbi:GNAT family N-acetyltransferase [Nocardioides terrisoli]|uniref:GNAT family N-acetyltransferase n=1 Tax=Nocardioides terrisoli TaxID=3388267 RepID=UPI00287B712E|nr:GNAT family N-acetyltransferase [Nocardioides marmorisolisilvae]
MTSADVSCRVAWADDAAAIAAVQVRAWRESYAELFPPGLLDTMQPDELAQGWAHSLTAPPDARNRVLVALERNLVTGFAMTGPATDPDCDAVADGEITDLTIDPHKRGQGHGSRLMQACVDTLRADRFVHAVTWLASTDDALRTFLTSAGWAPDGAHRTLDLHGDGTVTVNQVRLHTDLGAPGAD